MQAPHDLSIDPIRVLPKPYDGPMAGHARSRKRLVETLRRRLDLHDRRILDAFRDVPRHLFLPDRPANEVYRDDAIVTKRAGGIPVSSSSQPAMMALMLDQLALEPGMRVLEIGAGTGFNAALIGHLVGRGGAVTTIDIDPELAERARAHLATAELPNVRVVAGDGGLGAPDHAPYDRVIATASCWEIPPPWLEQLADGGILVLPLRVNGTGFVAALRREGAALRSTRIQRGGFMVLRGAFGHDFGLAFDEPLGNGVTDLRADAPLPPRLVEALPALLAERRSIDIERPEDGRERDDLLAYLLLQGLRGLLPIRRRGPAATPSILLVASPGSAIEWSFDGEGLYGYGDGAAERLVNDAVARWEAEGRPGASQLQMTVTPSVDEELPPLPAPFGRVYRMRRGAHDYELSDPAGRRAARWLSRRRRVR